MNQVIYYYFISDLSYNFRFYDQDDFIYLNKIYYEFSVNRFKNNEIYNARQILMKNLNYIVFLNEQSDILQQKLFMSFYFKYKPIVLATLNHFYLDTEAYDYYRFSHLNYMLWLNLPDLLNNVILDWRWGEKKYFDFWWEVFDQFMRTKWDSQVDHKARIDKYNLYFYTFDNPINVSYFSEYNYILLYYYRCNWKIIKNKKYFKNLRKKFSRIYIKIYKFFYKYIYSLFK